MNIELSILGYNPEISLSALRIMKFLYNYINIFKKFSFNLLKVIFKSMLEVYKCIMICIAS